MTVSLIKRSLVVIVTLSVVALCLPSGAWSQTQAAPSQASNGVDVLNPPADAEKTASGLAMKVLIPGVGTVHPGDQDVVKVLYVVHTQDGRSLASGPVTPLQMNAVAVPGLVEGLKHMVSGEKRRVWMPEKLAFNGAKGRPAGPVAFDVTLIEIVSPPTAPPDVSEPPADAEKTKSGLASKVVKPGTGVDHPSKKSTVTVHYSGWTTDGQMFDSSVMRGKPASFPLDRVIAGWTEGVQLMVPGETRRFWIPEKLAYQGQEGKPKGMLVFDVELISIDEK
ncbi:MAG TPA: FKBP-type peptidyl-prolyl cis-trans isomerase [Vicinamibacterales bacterium]|nr:FKBP-type peptidyl-prolyl cis-trans isomerase [Vicinamibacterales bacterium]